MRVWGLKCRVKGLEFRIEGILFKVWVRFAYVHTSSTPGSEFRV